MTCMVLLFIKGQVGTLATITVTAEALNLQTPGISVMMSQSAN